MTMNQNIQPGEPQKGEIQVRRSLLTRVLGLALGVIIFAIVVTTAVMFVLARNVIQRARQTSSESLRAQAQAYLVQINRSTAEQNNLILDRAVKDVRIAAETSAALFKGELPIEALPIYKNLVAGPQGQLMNTADDPSSVFVPSTQNPSPELERDIDLSAYLDLVLPAIQETNPNAAAMYFGSERNLVRYYPNIMLGEVVPPDFSGTGRPWYVSARDENAGKMIPEPVWSSVYQDATGLGLVTTIAMPVYEAPNRLVGVIGMDLTLNEISNNIATTQFLKTGYSFLIDGDGHSIVLSRSGYLDLLGREPQENEFGTDLNEAADRAVASIIQRMREGESGFEEIQTAGKDLYIAFAPLESTGWSLGSVVAAQDVLQSVTTLESELQQETNRLLLSRVIPIGLLLSAGLLIIALLLIRRLTNPIHKLTVAAAQIGSGRLEAEFPSQRDDEIGLLARTLEEMASQVHQSLEQLEMRVAERTQQLEKRSVQIQTAAEVGRDVAEFQDLNTLMNRAVNLISDKFGYYNVGIFLVDEAGEYVHLRAASGDLGKMLLERNIRFRVGQQGIVGYVSQFAQVRVSDDVQTDPMYHEESLLTDTRSEVAIPLLGPGLLQEGAGPRAVIGVLDIQSTSPNAFTEDDVAVLRVLADQLGTAIQNSRLVNQLQTTLKDLNLISQQQARQAWLRYSAETGGLAFVYDRTEVKPALPLDAPPLQPSEIAAGELHDRLVIPIRLRDQVIGLIGIENDDPERAWSEDEVAILQSTAEQAALSVENARLLAESQRKALREQVTGEITSHLRSSLDMETVLRTAMNEIAQKLGVAQLEVQLRPQTGAPDGDGDDFTDHPHFHAGDGRHE